jgi:EmrB/QacA subfamily drug resistance transporter
VNASHQQGQSHLRAALILAGVANFMVILDIAIVNVALPPIRHALGFSEVGLQWVLNGYTITSAGFLLLGGRAADLLGHRSVFVWGMLLFAIASLTGGLADSRAVMLSARLAQGLGAAVIAPASLSIITSAYSDARTRHRAVGIWGAAGAVGGSSGALLGGLLTGLLSWRWIFFINVPIALVAAIAARHLLSERRRGGPKRNFDLAGALTGTIGLSVLVFGIVRTNSSGWGDRGTLTLILAGLGVLGLFLAIEGRIAEVPLMPLRLFRSRRLSVANTLIVINSAASFGMWFFFSVYLQEVKGYTPIRAGLTFLPMNLSLIVTAAVVSRAVQRVGTKLLQVLGMIVMAVGLGLFTRMTVTSGYLADLLVPSMLSAIGMQIGLIPGTIAAVSDIDPREAGLASAVTNTARLFGSALGLAILATIATTQTNSDLRHPTAPVHTTAEALVSGFRLAFVISALMALCGAALSALLMPGDGARLASEPEIVEA